MRKGYLRYDKDHFDFKHKLILHVYTVRSMILFVWLVSQRPHQLLGYIVDGPQDRASDNFTCCHR